MSDHFTKLYMLGVCHYIYIEFFVEVYKEFGMKYFDDD